MLKQIVLLMSGTFLSQILVLAASPLLTRIYSPEDFGLYAWYLSVFVIISAVATLRYELAILSPKNDRDAKTIAISCIMISLILGLVLLLVVLTANALFNFDEKYNLLKMMPLVIILVGIQQTITYILNRELKYKQIAQARFINAIVQVSLSFMLAVTVINSYGLIFAHVIGILGSIIFMLKITSLSFTDILNINAKRAYANLKKFNNYPYYNLPHSLIDAVKDIIVIYFLFKYTSQEVVGAFFLVAKIMLAPVSLIGASVSQVLLRRMHIDINAKQNFSSYVLRYSLYLSVLSFIAAAIYYNIGDKLFITIFGEKWVLAAEISVYFVLYSSMHFVASALSTVLIACGHQRLAFILNVIYVSIYCLTLILPLIYGYNIVESSKVFSISMFLYLFSSVIVTNLMAIRYCQKREC